MITEGNITHESDTPSLDTRSDIGGRMWARMIALAMEYGCSSIMFWSVQEGSGTVDDRGYLDGSGNERGSYRHYKAMAKWFHGTYMKDELLNAKLSQTGNTIGTSTPNFYDIDMTNSHSCKTPG